MNYLSEEYIKTKKTWMDTNGYEYFFDVDHPLQSNGKVYLHRHIASIMVGRWLTTKEHVHHKDGKKNNNSPENLAIMSHSEHAKIEMRMRGYNDVPDRYCDDCGKKLYKTRKNKTNFCPTCLRLSRRKFNPSKEELERLVWKMPTVKVAKLFGVSDKAVSKRCKMLGINKPARGYWEKEYHSKK